MVHRIVTAGGATIVSWVMFSWWPPTVAREVLLISSMDQFAVHLPDGAALYGGGGSMLPFGCCLAIGAALAATVGPSIVDWYVGLL